MNSIPTDDHLAANWNLLYRVGGFAAFITVFIIPIAIVSHLIWLPPPWSAGAAADWLLYIQDKKMAGLLNLNSIVGNFIDVRFNSIS
jgi:hypothetical protein